MNQQKETLTRKEIGELTPKSEYTIFKKNNGKFARKIGLDKCQIPFTSRPHLYWKEKVISCFEKAGLIVKP